MDIVRPVVSYLFFMFDLRRGRYTSSNGREQRLLQYVKDNTPPNDPQAVLDAIDKYAHSQEFYMNVGDGKGKVMIDELNKLATPPKAVLELGTYCGYSTILLAKSLTNPAAKVYTVDICPENIEVAKAMIAHAGLTDKVVHVEKPLDEALQEVKSALAAKRVSAFDLVFIDHEKTVYLSDLQLLVKEGLLREGSVVIADNLKIPGAPEYVKWMRTSPEFDFVEHSVCMGASALWLHDIIGVSHYKPTAAVAAAAT